MHARVHRLRSLGVLVANERPPESEWAAGTIEMSSGDFGTGRRSRRLVLRMVQSSPDMGLIFELFQPTVVNVPAPYLRLRGVEEVALGGKQKAAVVQEWLVRFVA